jgi:hypothetical protein
MVRGRCCANGSSTFEFAALALRLGPVAASGRAAFFSMMSYHSFA